MHLVAQTRGDMMTVTVSLFVGSAVHTCLEGGDRSTVVHDRCSNHVTKDCDKSQTGVPCESPDVWVRNSCSASPTIPTARRPASCSALQFAAAAVHPSTIRSAVRAFLWVSATDLIVAPGRLVDLTQRSLYSMSRPEEHVNNRIHVICVIR